MTHDDHLLDPTRSDMVKAGEAATLNNGEDSLVLRMHLCGVDRPFILKMCRTERAKTEVRCYRLLQELGVPILPVRAIKDKSIVLEDLECSGEYRLAGENDAGRPAVGAAVAAWYRELHVRGSAWLADRVGEADSLPRECDALDAATVREIGRRLAHTADRGCDLAAEHLEALQSAYRRLPQTLNHNDFHWSNLALSRDRNSDTQAVVFDYHLMGIGARYSDYRNVISGLSPRAATAFREAYGPVDAREAIFDEPLAILYALHVALRRPKLPRWAIGLVEKVSNGELERCVRRALTTA